MRMGIWFFVALLLPFGAAAEEAVQTGSVELPAADGMRVSVENISGSILVEGSDSGLVQAAWTVTCGSEEELEALEVIVSTDSGLGLSVDYSDDWDRCVDCSVDFILSVPRSVSLNYDLAQVNGSIELSEAMGTAELNLVNGEAALSGFHGAAGIEAVNGEVRVEGSPGLQRVDMVNGTIVLILDEQVEDLSVGTVNAGVTIELGTEAAGNAETMSGELIIDPEHDPEIVVGIASKSASFGDPSGEVGISITTLNGDIEIR